MRIMELPSLKGKRHSAVPGSFGEQDLGLLVRILRLLLGYV